MRTAQSFDATTERWHIVAVDRTSVTPFAEEFAGVWISRDASGAPAECLVTEDVIRAQDGAARAFVQEEFEIDLSGLGALDGHASLSLEAFGAGASDLPATRTIREPGIPFVHSDGTVHVPTEDGDIRVSSSGSVMMIDVPVRASRDWVRISDAATGGLLALGQVRSLGSGFGANLTFGIEDSYIHIALTDTPLEPVPDRQSRRVDWIDSVIANVRRRWWRHPFHSRSAARDAAAVAGTLGEKHRASVAARYARLVPAYLALVSVGAAATVFFALSALLPRNEPILAVDGPSSATYGFGGEETVTVTVDVTPDGSLTLLMSDRIAGTHDFGGDAANQVGLSDESTYRARCLAAKDAWIANDDIRTVSTDYTVLLRSAGHDPVLLGTVRMTSNASEMTTTEKACNAATLGADGSFVADVTYRRSTEEFSLPAADGVDAAATWDLAIERAKGGASPVPGQSLSPVTFTVDRDS